MAVVPLTLFLARRDGNHGDVPGGPKSPDIRAATEAWYQKGIAEGMEKAREASEAALAQKEEECKSKANSGQKELVTDTSRTPWPANHRLNRWPEKRDRRNRRPHSKAPCRKSPCRRRFI